MDTHVKPYLVLLFVATLFGSCGKRQTTLCSADGERCITIEDRLNTRVIYFESGADVNYVKLDISKVDLEAEGIFICWRNESGKLEVVSPKTSVLSQSYDTGLYEFDNKLKEDERGRPDIRYFHKEGCLEYNILSNSVFPRDHAIIKE